MLGIYQPTAGVLHIGGKVFEPGDGVRLGYLPEERGLYKKEAVLDVMVYFFVRLKGLSKAQARSWSLKYLDRVELADKASTRLDKLSGGEQQKIQLGVTIMNDPELLILDEPTKGFDPGPLIVGALLLLGGFTLFTAVLVAIGAIMPTAKKAGVVFGPLMALIFVPFYAISLILSDPHFPAVQAFTCFPLSPP